MYSHFLHSTCGWRDHSACSRVKRQPDLDLDKYLFPLSNQIQIKFYFGKKNQIKSNQISWIMICASNFFQIICFNKNKTNQIKSNLWDNVFYFKFFFKFFTTTKINQIKSNFLDHDLYFKFFSNFWVFALTYQIKSNQILWLLFDRSNWNKLIWFDLIWTIFRPFQIICPGLSITPDVQLGRRGAGVGAKIRA